MATLYSKQDLRERVLHDLAVTDIQESSTAEDAAIVDPIVAQSLAELSDENLIQFDTSVSDTTQNIPANTFSALADFVRYHVAPAYTLPKDENLRNSAMYRLRKSLLVGSDDVVVRANYY